jgi:hypothetical protein
MMGHAEIRYQSTLAAVRAAKERKAPYTPWPQDLASLDAFQRSVRVPFLGDYLPDGWKRSERDDAFVDTSGFGSESEPALTQDGLRQWMRPGYGYAVTEAGQFQAYVAEYEKVATD